MKYLISLLLPLFLLLACQPAEQQSSKTEKAEGKQETQTKGSDGDSRKKALEPYNVVDIPSTQQLDMTSLLSTATKVEFLFYVDPANPSISSISTETDNVPQIRNFAQYITNMEIKNPKCLYMGSALFKNEDGDILFDGEFNLSQECVHFKMIYDGKTTYRKITPQGLDFLTQFYMMVTNQIRQQMQ